jgi:hypothetical protein
MWAERGGLDFEGRLIFFSVSNKHEVYMRMVNTLCRNANVSSNTLSFHGRTLLPCAP